MKLIVAGSRSIKSYKIVAAAVNMSGFKPTEIVSGHANGVDASGEVWAQINNVPIKLFPADWNAFGKRAGFVRNQLMAEYADALVAIWDGTSPGTDNMIDYMRMAGKPVFAYKIYGNGYVVSRSIGCPRACQARMAGLNEPEDCGAGCNELQCGVQ